MKRKIPVFRVSDNPQLTRAVITAHPEIKRVIINELVFVVKDGLKTNKNSISLFELNNSNIVVDLDKSQWVKSLNVAMNYFAELEDYNKCIEIRELVKKIK